MALVRLFFPSLIPLDEHNNVWKGEYEEAPRYALVPSIAGGKFLTPDGKIPKNYKRQGRSRYTAVKRIMRPLSNMPKPITFWASSSPQMQRIIMLTNQH